MWLVFHKDNLNHFSGVFLFCAGSASYSISLLRLAGDREKVLARARLAMEIFLFVSSVALVIAFITLWAIEENHGEHIRYTGGLTPDGEPVRHMGELESDETEHAYIVEHVAYIVFLLFYTAFFALHTPDPTEPPGLREMYAEEEMNMGHVVMKPLLRPSGA